MKKRLIFTGLLALLFAACCFAQKPYKVVFYNLENFFDTINDPEVNDDEFTPEGPKKWNSVKYAKKLGNTEKVLFDIAGIDKDYPIVIGVSEVENRSVLEDIIATPKMAPGNYRISHYDSPEARGVDVAFMYRPDVFKLEGSAPIRTQILRFRISKPAIFRPCGVRSTANRSSSWWLTGLRVWAARTLRSSSVSPSASRCAESPTLS